MEPRGRAEGGVPGSNTNGGAAVEPPSGVEDQFVELRQRMSEMSERVVAKIRDRPISSLLIAAAAGYLMGRIFR